MISVNKILLITAAFYLSANILFAQNEIEKQYDYAKNLFEKEEYYDAITEFKRLLFFDKEKEYFYSANIFIGFSYKMGAKFSDAIKHFKIAELNSSNDEELFNSKIEIIRINILRRTTGRAILLLDSLISEFPSKRNEINYWKGWTYIFEDNWERASEEFAKINPDHELKKLSDEVEDKKYSVTTARVLAFIIPGSGQFYTGNYLSGFISLGWNLLWGYVTVNSFVEERIFDGIVVGELLWLRFYRGNIQNAEKFAEENNLQISNKALHYLQHEYEGLKP